MVLYHLNYDLYYNYGINFYFDSIASEILQKFISISFILLSGITCQLSKNNLNRGLKLFLISILITLVTYIYDNSFYIKFGIIHLISVSIIIYSFLSKFKFKAIFSITLVFIFISFIVSRITINNNYFFIFGLYKSSFSSLDYFPIFPYISIFFIGVIIGRLIYKNKISIINIKGNILSYIGKKSMFIYLIHQPIIVLFLKLISFISKI